MHADNIWWTGAPVREDYAALKPRGYFGSFARLVTQDDARQRPQWCVEVKWSDRVTGHPEELRSLAAFSERHPQVKLLATTHTQFSQNVSWLRNARLDLLPTSLYCFAVGHRAVHSPSDDTTWILGD